MGCTQSKIENEEAVARCKERKQYMKEAVSARNAFAAAHSSYAMGLKNTGAALSDYAHGEAHHSAIAASASSLHPALPSSSSTSASASAAGILEAPPVDTLPPPPPPPSNFGPAAPPPPPLQRAVTMPEINIPKPDLAASRPPRPKPIVEDEEEVDDLGEASTNLRRRRRGGGVRGGSDGLPLSAAPPVAAAFQQQQDTYDFFFNYENMPRPTLGEMEGGGGGASSSSFRNEEIDRNAFDDVPKRPQVEEEIPKVNEVTEEVPKVRVEEDSLPSPPPPEAAAAVAGKSMKKAKQVAVGAGPAGLGKRPINLLQIFVDLDDHFLKASESAHEVSKMLEATRLHYHSNFADNRGHIDHSARVMRVITWNRSFRGLPNNDDGNDDFDSEENETHATVLDKLLAWEKKLYDEVKAGEVMKFEYQRKVNSLNKLKKRGTNSDALEKAKASVSLLHTRYIVDMQAMDSTVSEINRLRDEQLYPKLVQLVDGMATMWETMRHHHESQSKMVQALRYIDMSQTLKETSEHHHNTTAQLYAVVQEWRSQFDKLVHKQRDYIRSLHSWLKLNLIPTESTLKEKVSSPPRPQTPPILKLLIAWQDHLERLPDDVARSAIANFAAVIDTIAVQQDEEMRMRERCEDTRKELAKKTRAFEDWYHKYTQRRVPDELDPERIEGNPHDPIVEKQSAVDLVRKRLEEEEESYKRHCIQVREKSLVSLKNRLPELFMALCEFSNFCSAMYSDLRAKSQPRTRNESSA